jgi:hypothetical protein
MYHGQTGIHQRPYRAWSPTLSQMSLVPTYPLINEKKVRGYAKRKVLSDEVKEGEVYWAYESGRMFIYSKEE